MSGALQRIDAAVTALRAAQAKLAELQQQFAPGGAAVPGDEKTVDTFKVLTALESIDDRIFNAISDLEG